MDKIINHRQDLEKCLRFSRRIAIESGGQVFVEIPEEMARDILEAMNRKIKSLAKELDQAVDAG